MSTEPVVVIGGGQAGLQAAASLRDNGYSGPMTLLAGEGTLPYQRPPLSKGYLAGQDGDGDLPLRPESFYPEHGIELIRGDPAAGLHRRARQVELRSGARIGYQRAVLATGARPRELTVPGATLPGVFTLRTLADATRLRRELAPGRRLVVIGAGMIGFELAATAAGRGMAVTVVEALPRAMERVASGELAGYLTAEQRRNGVTVLLDRTVSALRAGPSGRVASVDLEDGERLPADLVVVAVGVVPDDRLARDAGLATGNGVLVDGLLRSSDPAVFAIGDCARYPCAQAGGDRVRLESVPNAAAHGRHVAAVLCGARDRYEGVPWFWSDQHGAVVQIAGLTGGHDHTAVAGSPADGRFSVFCFRGRRLVGVESVNRPADHIRARRLMAGGDPGVTPEDIAATGAGVLAAGAGRRQERARGGSGGR
jgi:3-phenylpropionate/trans-cinnamate dioxygenase ferredoxin reductase subunit